MTVKTASTAKSTRTLGGSVLKSAAVNVVLAVIVNLILWAVLRAALNLPADFPPLQAPAIIIVTIIGTVLAGAAYAIIARISQKPNRTYWIVALVALVISILPNFGAMANPASFPFPGGSAQSFGVLIVFHAAAALVSILTLTNLSGKKDR